MYIYAGYVYISHIDHTHSSCHAWYVYVCACYVCHTHIWVIYIYHTQYVYICVYDTHSMHTHIHTMRDTN